MKAKVSVIFLLQLFLQCLGRSLPREDTKCELRLNKDIPKDKEPVLLSYNDGRLSLALPSKVGSYDAILVDKLGELVLACPGSKNYVAVSNNLTSMAVCEENNVFTIGSTNYTSDKFNCLHDVTSSLLITNRTCAGTNGTILQIGFNVTDWHPLIEVCHNIESSITYYSSHVLYGQLVNGKVTQVERKKFKRGSDQLFKGFDPDDAYDLSNQVKVVTSIVGDTELEKYLRPKEQLFLARGHLAPKGDFLFGSWQQATFFYANVAPQWQTINAGTWNVVENKVRQLANNLGSDLKVITGTEGVMELSGTEVDLEDTRRLAVPGYYWKLVISPATQACIALIVTNDPFLESPPPPPCPDACLPAHWPLPSRNFTKGYLFCCTYQGLKDFAPYVPKSPCKTLLKYENK